jgi:hypothetical protein
MFTKKHAAGFYPEPDAAFCFHGSMHLGGFQPPIPCGINVRLTDSVILFHGSKYRKLLWAEIVNCVKSGTIGFSNVYDKDD